MKITPAPETTAESFRDGGFVAYIRAGVLVGRKVVKPVNRMSAAQTSERSFQVAATRAWNGQMTAAERATWEP